MSFPDKVLKEQASSSSVRPQPQSELSLSQQSAGLAEPSSPPQRPSAYLNPGNSGIFNPAVSGNHNNSNSNNQLLTLLNPSSSNNNITGSLGFNTLTGTNLFGTLGTQNSLGLLENKRSLSNVTAPLNFEEQQGQSQPQQHNLMMMMSGEEKGVVSPIGEEFVAKNKDNWPCTQYPMFTQPPQIAYGWFVPHPPPQGPYFWPCLPPGYALTPAKAVEPAAVSSSQQTSGGRKRKLQVKEEEAPNSPVKTTNKRKNVDADESVTTNVRSAPSDAEMQAALSLTEAGQIKPSRASQASPMPAPEVPPSRNRARRPANRR